MRDRRTWILWLLVAFYVASRIPVILSGFGSDYDSLLYGASGAHMLEKGTYEVSRFPGFPLYEHLCAFFLLVGDWELINLATAIVSLLALGIYYRILGDFGYADRTRALLCVLLAVFPQFWVNSAAVMDYNWALLFVLGSYLALLRDRWELSALCLGLACGFRLTSGLFLIPFSLYTIQTTGSRKRLIAYGLILGLMTLIAYAPLFLRYGIGFLRPSPFLAFNFALFLLYFLHRIYQLIGVVPGLFLCGGLLVNRRQLRQVMTSRDPDARIDVLVVVMHLLLFMMFPGQPAYLLPMIPFALSLMARVFSFRYLVTLCTLVFLYNFVSLSLYNSKERTLEIRVREGVLLSDLSSRKFKLEFHETLAHASFPEHSLVIVQGIPMAFGMSKQSFQIVDVQMDGHTFPAGRNMTTDQDVLYLNGLALALLPNSAEILDLLKEKGYTIYMQKELYVICRKAGDLFHMPLKEHWDVQVFEMTLKGVLLDPGD